MFKIISRVAPVFFSLVFLIFVIFQIPYPETLTQASLLQISLLFIPLFLTIAFTFNIFLKSLPVSFSLSLGIIFLLILKALDSLNIVTALVIIIAVGLLISYFRKIRKRRLTKLPKIPKLTRLRKQ